jgi:uncharacterized membrane protein YeiB
MTGPQWLGIIFVALLIVAVLVLGASLFVSVDDLTRSANAFADAVVANPSVVSEFSVQGVPAPEVARKLLMQSRRAVLAMAAWQIAFTVLGFAAITYSVVFVKRRYRVRPRK